MSLKVFKLWWLKIKGWRVGAVVRNPQSGLNESLVFPGFIWSEGWDIILINLFRGVNYPFEFGVRGVRCYPLKFDRRGEGSKLPDISTTRNWEFSYIHLCTRWVEGATGQPDHPHLPMTQIASWLGETSYSHFSQGILMTHDHHPRLITHHHWPSSLAMTQIASCLGEPTSKLFIFCQEHSHTN